MKWSEFEETPEPKEWSELEENPEPKKWLGLEEGPEPEIRSGVQEYSESEEWPETEDEEEFGPESEPRWNQALFAIAPVLVVVATSVLWPDVITLGHKSVTAGVIGIVQRSFALLNWKRKKMLHLRHRLK